MSQPRNLVNLDAVTKGYGGRALLDGVSLGVAAGDRVGVVGRNGGGKSTLLEVLSRLEPPDAGRVTHARDLRLGMLPQVVTLPEGATVRDLVLGDAAEHAWAGDARVREVLDGLGLHRLGLDSVVDPLSGGERRRVALAALLVRELDLLVLDEPTNHLDVEGVDWLARHLGAFPAAAALVVVTHDRWFLDAVSTATWEVDGGQVHAYDGGYAAYVLARAERARQAAATETRRQNLLRKELAWLRRGPPARTSKPRFRIEAANALIADEPPPRDQVALQRFAATRLGRTVYEVEGASLRLGDRTLLDRVTWRLGPGDRVGVLGPNGSGKTSLLRLLAGELRPAAGRVVRGKTVKPAYLPQEAVAVDEVDGTAAWSTTPTGGAATLDAGAAGLAGAGVDGGGERAVAVGLDPGERVLDAVESVARRVQVGKGRELTAVQLLERFGFRPDQHRARAADLSGGERRRLQLLRVLLSGPNVLLLDEPTNDLDVDTLTALEDVLDTWPGTLVVVSHDRYFLERTCTRLVALLGDGRLTDLPGGVDEYLARRHAAAVAPQPAAGAGAAGADGPRPDAAQPDQRAAREARKALARLERQLERLEQREAELHAEMAASAADYTRLARMTEELRTVQARKAETEDAWLELSASA
jgi:ATP-binding cassette subfamily F protein uup